MTAQEKNTTDWFRKVAQRVSLAVGSPGAFGLSLFVIIVWALLGPVFQYSDTWQLIINTGTTIVTFLMVFLIQNTQNRDARAIHLKLDELIRANRHARNKLIDLEQLSDEELNQVHIELVAMIEENTHRLKQVEHKRSSRV
jgi:low affinity Fe/Cu permease